MKRIVLTFASAALLASSFTPSGKTTAPFDRKLPQDQQIVHVLDRLTFGPRPGDVEEVRRIGVAKWIRLQLHPDQIPENPVLEARLKPLDTLEMPLPEIVSKYGTPPQPLLMMQMQEQVTLNKLLSQDDLRRVMNGTAEERTEVLKSLDPDKRAQVLALIPPTVLKYTPDFQQEADAARKARDEEYQKEIRKLNPKVEDLLTADQIKTLRTGSKDQVADLLASLPPDKRPVVATFLPAQRRVDFLELYRQGQFLRAPQNMVGDDLKQAKVYRAIYSNRQLQEVLVDFWFNHFNIDENKNVPRVNNALRLLTSSYERDAIRPHVLGHFKDLLLATARHPAMLYYLDNWESMSPGGADVGPFSPSHGTVNGVPNSVIPSPVFRIAHGLNENYGRELMELHTLGVKAGYTQDDVIAVARCFTGWTVRSKDNPEYTFASFMHDFGEKTVLGHRIAAGGGEQDGLQVIDILVRDPATAKFISRELAQRFVADDPPQSLVDRMAATFRKTDGDLRAVMETMFTSREFMSEGAYQAKVKSPFEMVVSAVRAVGGDVVDPQALVQRTASLGEPLYDKLDPNGYPNTGESWLSSAGLVGRMNFASALVAGRVPGVKPDPSQLAGKDPSVIVRELLGHDASPATEAAITQGIGNPQDPGKASTFVTTLVLGSPDFQRR